MLVAMTNNPMVPETWHAAIDMPAMTLDVATGEEEGRVEGGEPELNVC
jgi:hypothetical protein